MAFEYDVYLDSTLLADIPGGMDDFALTVIREGGVTSDDQVLRIKTESDITFWGDGYAYLCAAKQNNYCANVDVKIFMKCDEYRRLAFIGLLPLVGTIADPTRKTMKAKIRDNSFSGYIRERQNNKVFLTATTSANGVAISACPSRTIAMFSSSTGVYGTADRRVYDVYQVLKYLITYLSDGTVSTVSDYFTSGAGYNKYAIAMGGMLYGGTSWPSQTDLPAYFTPSVTFAEVFKEVRKMLRIYMSIDTDINGNATVRIEPEAYFYSNTALKVITGLPHDLIEEYDLETIYSEIRVGSPETKVEDGTYYYYPQLALYSFQKEVYNSCSDCVEDNALELTSEWVTDSNVIWFTVDQDNSTSGIPDSGANTINGDKTFLIQTSTTLDQAEQTVYQSIWYYNAALTNDQVLTNWAGGIPACVESTIDKEPCVNVTLTDQILQHEDNFAAGAYVSNHLIAYDTVVCNSLGGLIGYDQVSFNQDGGAVSNDGFIYIAPFSGAASFTISVDATNILNYPAVIGGLEEYKWELKVYIFENLSDISSGGTPTSLATYTETYYVLPNFDSAVSNSFSINTGNITLVAGNVICACFRIRTDLNAASFSLRDAVDLTAGTFLMDYAYYDINDLEFVSDDYLRKPLRWTFTDPLCDTEFIDILADKTGYISVNGQQGWIKNIDYKPGKVSTITLQGINTLCC